MKSSATASSIAGTLRHLGKLGTLSIALLTFACATRHPDPAAMPESVATAPTLEEAIKALDVATPSQDEPVRMQASLYPTSASAGDTVTLIIKARIFPG